MDEDSAGHTQQHIKWPDCHRRLFVCNRIRSGSHNKWAYIYAPCRHHMEHCYTSASYETGTTRRHHIKQILHVGIISNRYYTWASHEAGTTSKHQMMQILRVGIIRRTDATRTQHMKQILHVSIISIISIRNYT